ncbi:toprim domain-containing protein [Kangiella koreensis]|uniref:Uncharacterized protein n=1 Tax=Kangiella koreensis (strain DSM 16069 / JCM 12317 / KCTC 12182 / SW-125) TaxID=523791 RepID=C7RCW3_KANKD|nr:hypothetical protein [Kangiella koreensis]ACV27105.1 hypothetical protein Kkor_1693 [Kangiella koreensis DSM 16069]
MTVPATEAVQTAETQEIVTTFASYGSTWAIYIGLVLLMIGIIWYAIRKWHFAIKWFIASVILAGALTPGHPVDYAETYSPLVLNSVVLLFDGDSAGFMAGIKTIIWVFVTVFLVGLAAWFGFKFWRKKQGQSNNKSATSKPAEKRMATPVEPTLGDEDSVTEESSDSPTDNPTNPEKS